MVAIAFDVLSLPLVFFNNFENRFFEHATFVTTAFWTADIICSFFTGYYDSDKGVTELRPLMVARRYLRSLFWTDMPIVVSDWALLLSGSQEESDAVSGVQVTKLSRVFRSVKVLKGFRLVRLIKVGNAFGKVVDSMPTSMIGELSGILKLLLAAIIVCHFEACFWYAIGKASEDAGEETWLQDFRSSEPIAGTGYIYLVSLHWALAQSTPAPIPIQPRNAYERGFTICTILVGYVVCASFLGNIASILTHVRQSAFRTTEKYELARRYIHENRVSRALGAEIMHCFRVHQHKRENRVLEANVEALSELPSTLRWQLSFEIYSPIVIAHPFFSQLEAMHSSMIQEICRRAMSVRLLAQRDELFSYNTWSEGMFFIPEDMQDSSLSKEARAACRCWRARRVERAPAKVILDYIQGGALAAMPSSGVEHQLPVAAKRCLCEASLWLRWQHQGTAIARSLCAVVCLNSADFREVTRCHTFGFACCKAYARLFHEAVTREPDRCIEALWDQRSVFFLLEERLVWQALEEEDLKFCSTPSINQGMTVRKGALWTGRGNANRHSMRLSHAVRFLLRAVKVSKEAERPGAN